MSVIERATGVVLAVLLVTSILNGALDAAVGDWPEAWDNVRVFAPTLLAISYRARWLAEVER